MLEFASGDGFSASYPANRSGEADYLDRRML